MGGRCVEEGKKVAHFIVDGGDRRTYLQLCARRRPATAAGTAQTVKNSTPTTDLSIGVVKFYNGHYTM